MDSYSRYKRDTCNICLKQEAGKRLDDAFDQFNVRFNETTTGAETSLGEILGQLTDWFQVTRE